MQPESHRVSNETRVKVQRCIETAHHKTMSGKLVSAADRAVRVADLSLKIYIYIYLNEQGEQVSRATENVASAVQEAVTATRASIGCSGFAASAFEECIRLL